ncbi:tyrosine-type recombinase/integrase [Deinococcus frigens]|uniref:tyrosine-type recombinase/integrase n=1 Tax=Deinococcus frigens TaxID=249403 RepID=UPI0012EBB80D|nr:tyrosine-type recombinase/integrase [Deinococcus frigens]
MKRLSLAVLIWLLLAGVGVAALFLSARGQFAETFNTDARILHRVLSQRMEQQEAVLNAVDALGQGEGTVTLDTFLDTLLRPYPQVVAVERCAAQGCRVLGTPAQRPPSLEATPVLQPTVRWPVGGGPLYALSRDIGRRLVTQLTTGDVQDLLKELRGRHADSTVSKVYRRLCRVLDLAVQEQVVVRNVAAAIQRKPTVKTRVPAEGWTTEEVQKIIRTTREVDPAMYPLVVMAFASSVRIGELVGARLQDYDLDKNVFWADGTAKEGGGRGKGKSDRAHRPISLYPGAQDVMLAHLDRLQRLKEAVGPAWGIKRVHSEETREKQRQAALRQYGRHYDQTWKPAKPVPTETHEWLFPTSRGTRDFKTNVGRRWHRILEAAQVKDRVFHAVRATWITAALDDNVPMHVIQAAVGHASPVMTLRYAERPKTDDAAARVARRLGLDTAVNPPKG